MESVLEQYRPPHIIHIACEELKIVVSTPHEEVVKCLDSFQSMEADKLRELYAGLMAIIVRFSFNRRSRRELKRMAHKEPEEFERIRCNIILFYCARYVLLGERIPSCDPLTAGRIRETTQSSPVPSDCSSLRLAKSEANDEASSEDDVAID